MAFRNWSEALRSVLQPGDAALGWGPPWAGEKGTQLRLPEDDDKVAIDNGGLRANRTTGVVNVDFETETIELVAIDYTGGESISDREAPAGFWEAAKQLPWPLPER